MTTPVLTADEATALAREVFALVLRPSFPWFTVPGLDDFLGYALWNETAWPFARDESTLRRQLEEYRDRAARPLSVAVAVRRCAP